MPGRARTPQEGPQLPLRQAQLLDQVEAMQRRQHDRLQRPSPAERGHLKHVERAPVVCLQPPQTQSFSLRLCLSSARSSVPQPTALLWDLHDGVKHSRQVEGREVTFSSSADSAGLLVTLLARLTICTRPRTGSSVMCLSLRRNAIT